MGAGGPSMFIRKVAPRGICFATSYFLQMSVLSHLVNLKDVSMSDRQE